MAAVGSVFIFALLFLVKKEPTTGLFRDLSLDFTLCQFKYQPQISDFRSTCPQNKSHDTCESSELFSYLNELEALCPLPPQPPFVSLSPLLWSRPSVVLVSFLCPSPKCEARSTSVAAIAAKAFPPRDKNVQQFQQR